MMKKVCAWLVLVGTFWCGVHLKAQDSPDLTFDLGEVNACFLDTVHIPVTVTDFDSIMGFQFYAEWDTSALKLLSITSAYPNDFSLVFNSAQDLDNVYRTGVATTDLLNPDVSIARTYPDGDTIIYIHAVMRANSGVVPLTSGGATFFSNSFFYAENGVRSDVVPPINVAGGEVGYVNEVEGLNIVGDTITCSLPEARLIASADNDLTDFAWFRNGEPLGTMDTLFASRSGLYQLEASRDPSCITEVTYEVEIDTAILRPEVSAGLLPCDPAEAMLGVVDVQPDAVYAWEAPGAVVSPGQTYTATEAGDYVLYTTLPRNGCVDTQLVVVAPSVTSAELAEASLSVSDTISCNQPTTTVSIDLPTDRFSFAWTAGEIAGNGNTLTVNTADPIMLVVTELADGCSRTLDTLIVIDTMPPYLTVAGNDQLNCYSDTTVFTTRPLSETPDFDYEWHFGGTVLSTEDSLVVAEEGSYELRVTSPVNGCQFDTLLSVTDLRSNPPLNFIELPTAVNCYSSTPIATISTGLNQLARWEGDSGLLSLGEMATLTEGNFSLSLTDTLTGCQADTSFVVGVDTIAPSFTIDSTGGISCEQGEVVLTISDAPEGTLCDWNGLGDGACNLSVSAAGTQVATVINLANGCQTTDSVVVIATDTVTPLEVTPDTTITCAEETITLAVGNLDPSLSYLWTDDGGEVVGMGPMLPTSEAGLFSVAVVGQSGACARTASVRVNVDTVRPFATIEPVVLNCRRPNAELTFSTNTPEAVATWFGPAMEPLSETTISDGGVYHLILTNPDNDCVFRSELAVPADFSPPEYSLNQPVNINLTCADNEVSLRVISDEEYSFRWSDGPGTIITEAREVSVVEAGTITLVVEDTLSFCTDTTLFTVTDLRTMPELSYSVPESFRCGEEEVELSIVSVPGQQYELTNQAGQEVAVVQEGVFKILTPGSYVLTTVDGVSSCVRKDTIIVAPPATDLSFGTVSVNQQSCEPGSVSEIFFGEPSGGTPEYSFEFNGTDYLPQDFVLGTPDGSYSLRLVDAADCFVDTTLIVRGYEPFTPTVLNLQEEYRLGDFVNLTIAGNLDPVFTYQYDWVTRDSICSNCSSLGFTALESSPLTVSVTRSDGCVETLNLRVRVNRNVRLYVPTAFSPNDDGINDYYLPAPGPEVERLVEMRVYDRWGGEVYRELAEENSVLIGWDGMVRGELATPGNYTATIIYELIDGRSQSVSSNLTLLR